MDILIRAIAITVAILVVPGAARSNEHVSNSGSTTYYRLVDPALEIDYRPTPGGQVVGSIVPENGVIAIYEVDNAMGHIQDSYQSRWVSLEHLEKLDVSMLPGTGLPIGLVCDGWEPGWQLVLKSDKKVELEYYVVERVNFSIDGYDSVAGAGTALDMPTAIAAQGTDSGGKPVALTAMFNPGQCAWHESEFEFLIEAFILLKYDGHTLLAGCCSLQPE